MASAYGKTQKKYDPALPEGIHKGFAETGITVGVLFPRDRLLMLPTKESLI